ncbi:DivIVA domain-containing protein [Seinonella peptonophila]
MELEQQVEELQGELEQMMDGEQMYPNPQTHQTHPHHQTQPQPQLQQQQTQTHVPARYPQQTEQMSLQPSVASLSSMEQSIHKSIRVAQEVAEEVRLNAKKEAELIVQEAEKNADRIINEALQKARAIHTELLDLKQKATIYRARFRTLVQSHLDILENSDWESLEELETNLDETGRQLEQFSNQPHNPELLMDQQTHEFHPMEDTSVLDEVATSYLEEEEEPRRELRRTSRKLKKKAMF